MISISHGDVIQVYLHSRYLSFSFCSVEQYVKNEQDKTVVDLDPDCIKRICQTITLVNVKLIICCLLTCKLNIVTICSVLNHSFVAFHI